MVRLIMVLLLSASSIALLGQDIEIRKTNQKIVIDGILDDDAWQTADSAYNFMQQFPSDTSLANAQTIAKILYDDQFVYISGFMFNLNEDRSYFTPSLRRDFFGDAVDSFSVIFDTFQDETNAFIFGINPYGVRREGLLTNGGSGREGFSLDWDNKWFGEAVMHSDGYWTAEMAIPLKTLRFNEGQSQWNLNFYRIDSEQAEKSTWTPISVNFELSIWPILERLNGKNQPKSLALIYLSFLMYQPLYKETLKMVRMPNPILMQDLILNSLSHLVLI